MAAKPAALVAAPSAPYSSCRITVAAAVIPTTLGATVDRRLSPHPRAL